jgi:hypothetical protein
VHQDIPGFKYLGDTSNGFAKLVDENEYENDKRWAPYRREQQEVRDLAQQKQAGSKSTKVSAASAFDFARFHAENRANAREIYLMAGFLGVHPQSLQSIQMGYSPETEDEPQFWVFPEFNGDGNITGIMRRYWNDDKKRMKGSLNGLAYAPNEPLQGDVLIVEGHSDVAAGLTMGLSVVGRPNNLGGSELLACLLAAQAKAQSGLIRRVIVLGENDEKDKGLFPGKDGAVSVATKLARLLGCPIAWSMPGEGVKDLREWLWLSKPNIMDVPACHEIGRQIVADITSRLTWIEPDSGYNRTIDISGGQTVSDLVLYYTK